MDNGYYLSKSESSILSEILERTQAITMDIRILSSKYISPISRYRESDLFCLRFLKWLHEQHQQSKNIPFATSDGNFSIYPSTDIPIIYYLPISSYKTLLHLPLFFHEFAHYLFEYHRREMKDLIIALQSDLEDILIQPYIQNDTRSHQERIRVKNIIEAWYDWIEELFCDAVGLIVGGKSFLLTFSMYLRMDGRQIFYLNEKELEQSSHPVSAIRIKFLIERAKKMGLTEEAQLIESDWQQMAELIKTPSIYHGYYHTQYDCKINSVLNNMLEEASPICYQKYIGVHTPDINFIELVNNAWDKYLSDSQSYEKWEREMLLKFTVSNSEFSSVTSVENSPKQISSP